MIARTNSFLLARRIKKRRKSAYGSVTQAGGYLLRQRLEFRHLSISCSLSFFIAPTNSHARNDRERERECGCVRKCVREREIIGLSATLFVCVRSKTMMVSTSDKLFASHRVHLASWRCLATPPLPRMPHITRYFWNFSDPTPIHIFFQILLSRSSVLSDGECLSKYARPTGHQNSDGGRAYFRSSVEEFQQREMLRRKEIGIRFCVREKERESEKE